MQGLLETVLSRKLQQSVRIIGAGRTDAGVHARGQAIVHTHAHTHTHSHTHSHTHTHTHTETHTHFFISHRHTARQSSRCRARLALPRPASPRLLSSHITLASVSRRLRLSGDDVMCCHRVCLLPIIRYTRLLHVLRRFTSTASTAPFPRTGSRPRCTSSITSYLLTCVSTISRRRRQRLSWMRWGRPSRGTPCSWRAASSTHTASTWAPLQTRSSA